MSLTVFSQAFRTIAGKLWNINQRYLLAILEEDVPNHTSWCLDALNPDIRTFASEGEQVMWGVPAATQSAYVYPSSAAAVTVVSSDSTDNLAGVGATGVLITGLLAGYVADTETLPLHATDGTVAVTSAKSWLRINSVKVTSAGTSGKNAGNLTIKSGANIVSFVEVGTNKAFVGVYTVPAGKAVFVDNGHGDGAGTKDVEIHVYQRLLGGLFTQEKHRTVNDNEFQMTCMKFPEKTDVEIRVHATVNGGISDITLEGWIE